MFLLDLVIALKLALNGSAPAANSGVGNNKPPFVSGGLDFYPHPHILSSLLLAQLLQ
jgi:hypothetical protein